MAENYCVGLCCATEVHSGWLNSQIKGIVDYIMRCIILETDYGT